MTMEEQLRDEIRSLRNRLYRLSHAHEYEPSDDHPVRAGDLRGYRLDGGKIILMGTVLPGDIWIGKTRKPDAAYVYFRPCLLPAPEVTTEVAPEVLLCNRIYISRNIAMDLTPEKMEGYLREIDVLCREESSGC